MKTFHIGFGMGRVCKFFELINSPQGPWLQMLQRVYYTDDPIDQVVADAKQQMKDIMAE